MKTGKFSKTYNMTEDTPYGPSKYRLTKEFRISEMNGIFFQTEITYRNGISTYRAQYPANTNYAKDRRQDVCNF